MKKVTNCFFFSFFLNDSSLSDHFCIPFIVPGVILNDSFPLVIVSMRIANVKCKSMAKQSEVKWKVKVNLFILFCLLNVTSFIHLLSLFHSFLFSFPSSIFTFNLIHSPFECTFFILFGEQSMQTVSPTLVTFCLLHFNSLPHLSSFFYLFLFSFFFLFFFILPVHCKYFLL